jgi:hypothetical protein
MVETRRTGQIRGRREMHPIAEQSIPDGDRVVTPGVFVARADLRIVFAARAVGAEIESREDGKRRGRHARARNGDSSETLAATRGSRRTFEHPVPTDPRVPGKTALPLHPRARR